MSYYYQYFNKDLIKLFYVQKFGTFQFVGGSLYIVNFPLYMYLVLFVKIDFKKSIFDLKKLWYGISTTTVFGDVAIVICICGLFGVKVFDMSLSKNLHHASYN